MLDREILEWIESLGLKTDAVQKLTGDASSRQYWRVNDKKFMLCHDPNNESFSNFIELQKYLNKIGINVPEMRAVQSGGHYLLDDLGDQTFLLELSNISHEGEYRLYQSAIDIMIKFQSANLNIPSIVKNRSFDNEKLLYEINMTLKYFLEIMLKVPSEQIEEIRSDFNLVINELTNKPMCFTHRDYHSRNLMIQNNEIFVIDFQDARMGLPHYDLVSLLEDCYIDTGSVNRKKLLEYYWVNSNKNLFHSDNFEDFMQIYYLSLIQRVFKAIGSFAYIYETRKDIRYLKYIGFAMEKIRRTLREINLETNLRSSLLKPYYES